MSKFKIRHITKYSYEVPVRDSANQIILYPIKDDYQEVLQHSLLITGGPVVEVHKDYFGNEVGTFTHSHPHDELVIDSQLIIVTRTRPLPEDTAPVEQQWKTLEQIKFQMPYLDYLKIERFDASPEVEKIIEDERCKNCSPLQSAKYFCEFVYKNFTYRKGITTVETTPDEIWKIKTGVCQDFAHILLIMLRLIHIPARYVSGYICPHKNGMRGEGATHAWVEAYIPFYGWIGLDPTNNCIVNETHVRLAVGKNFSDCSPVKGTYRGTSEHTLEVAVSVAYEDGETIEGENEMLPHEPIASASKNSYRRHQEMQMQQ
jgi:transglutaminase-like putative cysteine protease